MKEATIKTKRDPLVSPEIGDVVLSHGSQRTVYCEFHSGKIGWSTEWPIASGKITITAWRKWADGGEVILAVAE